MKFSSIKNCIGINWHLKFRLKIDELIKQNEKLQAKNNILERRIKKYEREKEKRQEEKR